MTKRALTDDQVRHGAALYAEGLTARQVAEQLGVTAPTVCRYFREKGIKLRPGHRPKGPVETVKLPGPPDPKDQAIRDLTNRKIRIWDIRLRARKEECGICDSQQQR